MGSALTCLIIVVVGTAAWFIGRGRAAALVDGDLHRLHSLPSYFGAHAAILAILPVQIYMWANEAERAFVERTSGAIIVLLVFLIIMNLGAIMLRRRFERRW
jgi:ABC-type phosphate transport system permease subunit